MLCFSFFTFSTKATATAYSIPVTGPFELQRLNHRAICRTKSPRTRMETGRAAFLPQELLLTRDVTSNAGNNGPFVGSRLVLM